MEAHDMTATETTSIDAATQIGIVALTVANLDRSTQFYADAMGFALHSREDGVAVLGTPSAPLLVLHEQAGADPVPLETTGLYHFAILVPTRADLGRWLRHWLDLGFEMPGQGDHIVSEALYLSDVDGNGIEIYRDRPREGWEWHNGQVRMGTGPVDIRGVIAEGDAVAEPWTGLPDGTSIGHMHLKVADIPTASTFYHDILGFDVIASMPSALFISAGGYHHHIGLNTWHSLDRDPAPETAAGLRHYTIEFASEDALTTVLDRLRGAGIPFTNQNGITTVQDPFANTLHLHVGPIATTSPILTAHTRVVA
jgi:catechol 2,3-dioxygenase